jgi:large subunit ribosomal protein L9
LKVILITDVKGIGERSQIVEVKDGYANNYLIPQGLALRATRGKTREVEQLAHVKMIRADRELAKARDVSSQIQEHSFEITAKVGAEGKLFGTITSREISEHIKDELGIEVDRKKIQLDEHIKHVGLYEAKLKLHPEDETIIHIKVMAEGEAAEAPKAEGEAAEAPKAEGEAEETLKTED